MRIRVTYQDQNEPFRFALPDSGVVGSVLKQVSLSDWGHDWFLLGLEEPFTYNGSGYAQILIRSRWEGNQVGGADPTSVFVLLIPDGSVLTSSSVASRDFEQAAWCMAETLQD